MMGLCLHNLADRFVAPPGAAIVAIGWRNLPCLQLSIVFAVRNLQEREQVADATSSRITDVEVNGQRLGMSPICPVMPAGVWSGFTERGCSDGYRRSAVRGHCGVSVGERYDSDGHRLLLSNREEQ